MGEQGGGATLRKMQEENEEQEEHPLHVKPGTPICDRPQFNIAAGFVIFVNALFMGIETDEMKPGAIDMNGNNIVDKPSQKVFFFLIENIFTVIFFLELLIRFYCLQFNFFRSGWNCMDFFLVSIAVLDTWIMTPMANANPDGGGNSRVLSTLRVLRMLRLVRLIRLLRMFRELWMIVQGLIDSLKTLVWVTMLMILFIYVCAIFTTLQIGHNDEVYDPYYRESDGWDHELFFGSVSRSMFTLVQIVTLERWSDGVARHVIANQAEMMIFFVFFLIFTSFGLMNMILGVIVENTLQMQRNNEEKVKKMQEKQMNSVLAKLREVLESADEDGSGSLTQEEFAEALNNPEIANQLRLIDFPVDDPDEIFMLLDVEQDGELTTDEFIEGCMRMKGQAKSKDLLEVQISVDILGRRLKTLDEKLGEATDRVQILDSKTRRMVTQAEQVFLSPREQERRRTPGASSPWLTKSGLDQTTLSAIQNASELD